MSMCQELSPMWRLTDLIVRSGFVMAWRLATSPTRTSPDLEKPTTEGVVRAPSALAITVGSPPSRTATTELVVPRSIPTALAMRSLLERAEPHLPGPHVVVYIYRAPRIAPDYIVANLSPYLSRNLAGGYAGSRDPAP